MNKKSFIKPICGLFLLLSIVSCNKIPQQNPDITLSEEEGKLVNLMINLDQRYAEWSINYDTSSSNYIYQAYYSDPDCKSLLSVTITRLDYSNGVITDITNWKYMDGETKPWTEQDTHVRWNKSAVTVYISGKKIKYPLTGLPSLKTSAKGFFVPATEISKIDENTYFYQRRKTDISEYTPWTAWNGDNYLEFDILEEKEKKYDILRIWNKDRARCLRFYMNGWMKTDNKYSSDGELYQTNQYIFNDKELSKGVLYSFKQGFHWIDIGALESPLPETEDEKTESSFYREYDASGRLIYERKENEIGGVNITIVSKTKLDLSNF